VQQGNREFECGKQVLSVGGQGIRVLDGDKKVDSFLYSMIDTWSFDSKKHVFEVKVTDGKKARTLKLSNCKSGSEAERVMTENWKQWVQAQQTALQVKKDAEETMRGKYLIAAADGAEVRSTEALDSGWIGVIAEGEVVNCDRVITNYEGTMTTRLHVAQSDVKQRNGSRIELEGWITLKNIDGPVALKVDHDGDAQSGDATVATSAQAVMVEAADTDEGSIDTRSEADSPSPQPVGNVEFSVTQVKGSMYNKKAAKSLKLSVSGMGVLIFEGLRPLDTIRFSEMKSWNFTPDDAEEGLNGMFSIDRNIKKKKDERGPATLKFVVQNDAGHQLIELMQETAQSLSLAKKKEKKAKKTMEDDMCGEYRVVESNGVFVRKSEQLDSDEVGVIAFGQTFPVDQVITKFEGTMKTRLHVSKTRVRLHAGKGEAELEGWITLKNNDGYFVKKVDPNAAEPDLEPEPETLEHLHPEAETLVGAEQELAELLDIEMEVDEADTLTEDIEKMREQGGGDGPIMIRALKASQIRAGLEMDSEKAGKLEPGEVFEVLEESVTSDGVKRIRMAKGWVSMTSSRGTALLVGEASVQRMLSTVPLFQHLQEQDRAQIANVLEAEEFASGQLIIRVGERGDAMYLIETGQAVAEKDGEKVMEYENGDYFGELALLTDGKRQADVRASGTDGARCLKLNRQAFEPIAAKCAAIMEQRQQMYADAGEDGEDGDDSDESDDESYISEGGTESESGSDDSGGGGGGGGGGD
jgi:hypothetical protein